MDRNNGHTIQETNDLTIDKNEDISCQSKSTVNLLEIPWNDVIFPYILRYLSWRDLFRLRSTSQTALQMTSEYFQSLSVIDLSLVSRRFTAYSFETIAIDCKNIRILNLSNCKWISTSLLLPIIQNNPFIVVLDISGCYELTNDILHKLATNCKSLKTLKLKDCHWVNGNAITDIGLNCSLLEDVNLGSCWEVSDDSAIDLITNCKNLKRLSLSKIYGITDRTLFALASNANNLEFLDVSGCWRITDYGIRSVPNCLSNVKSIQCFNSLRYEQKSWRILQYIVSSNCRRLQGCHGSESVTSNLKGNLC